MPDFFGEIDEVKNAVRQNIRSDVSATINKAHYKDGVSYELATALACEAVIDCFAGLVFGKVEPLLRCFGGC